MIIDHICILRKSDASSMTVNVLVLVLVNDFNPMKVVA